MLATLGAVARGMAYAMAGGFAGYPMPQLPATPPPEPDELRCPFYVADVDDIEGRCHYCDQIADVHDARALEGRQ